MDFHASCISERSARQLDELSMALAPSWKRKPVMNNFKHLLYSPAALSANIVARVSRNLRDFTQTIPFMQVIVWKRMWQVGKPFWVSDQRNVALLHLLGILALVAVTTFAGVYININNGHFMNAVGLLNREALEHSLFWWLGSLVLFAMGKAFGNYLRTRLKIIWRQWLTTSLFARSLLQFTAYLKLLRNPAIDNPDQRLGQDPQTFCDVSVDLSCSVIDSVVTIFSFVAVLWSLSSSLTIGVFGYAALGSIIVVYLGRRMPSINNQVFKTEADLRFNLSEVRREAERIASDRGERVADKQARARLGAVIAVLMDLMKTNLYIGLFTELYYALVPVIPAVVMGYFYAQGKIFLGDIYQAAGAFSTIFYASVFFVDKFSSLSTFGAVVNRLGLFTEALADAGVDPLPPSKRIDVIEGSDIAFDDVTVFTVDLEKVIVRGLTVHVSPGSNLLITGPNGSGKTTLVRVIAGLMNAGSGRFMRPIQSNIMFLSEDPFLPEMTLREALCYPSTATCMDDARLTQVLELVNLPGLLQRCNGFDTEQQWRRLLTISEMQRLGLARIILARPSFVILDEATSSLEEDNEKLLYMLLATIGSTYVSTSDSISLAKYHQQVLELDGSGGWQIHSASDYKTKGWKMPRLKITPGHVP
jgi:putative ATP-binding cassette transporter